MELSVIEESPEETTQSHSVKKLRYTCTRVLADGTVKEYTYERPSTAKPPQLKVSRKKEYTKGKLNELLKNISNEDLRLVIDFVKGLRTPNETPENSSNSENSDLA